MLCIGVCIAPLFRIQVPKSLWVLTPSLVAHTSSGGEQMWYTVPSNDGLRDHDHEMQWSVKIPMEAPDCSIEQA